MRQLLKRQVLEAPKASLRHLENLNLVRGDDPEILQLKAHLRRKIAEIENDEAAETAFKIAA